MFSLFYYKGRGNDLKILVELLGGTIGSHKDGRGTVVLGRDTTDILPESIDAVVRSPMTYSSENATAETYREALKAITKDMEETCPEGVLILHGTDTMAFFAQLAHRILGGAVPVQIAGSVLPPDDPDSDYLKQITDGIRFLEEGTSGVVCEGRSIPLDRVTSADISGRYGEHPDIFENFSGMDILEKRRQRFLSDKPLPKLLVIPAVPGAVIPGGGFDRVLIDCYHSGTAPVSLVPLIEKWTSEGIKVFLAPIPSGGNTYESLRELIGAGAMPLLSMPFEGAWAEALLT